MPPTPPDTTARLKAHYSGPFGAHTMLFHKAITAISDDSFVAAVRAVIALFAPLQWDACSWGSAEFAAASDPAFFPVASWAPLGGGSGDDPTAVSSPSAFLNWTGRGAASPPKRASLYLFEVQFQGANDMRFQSGENVNMDDVFQLLQDNTLEIGNIAGQPVAWHTYTNSGQNDFLTHRARRGA